MELEISAEQAIAVGRVLASRLYDLELHVAVLRGEVKRLEKENAELRKPDKEQ